MKKALKFAAIALLVLVVLLAGTAAYVLSWDDFGGTLEGERLARAQNSPQFKDGAFTNTPPQPAYDYMVTIKEMMGDQVRKPPNLFPAQKPDLGDRPAPGLRAVWLGHATVLIEIDGVRVLTDPMLSEHAFPIAFLAPARHNPPPISMEELPKIDIVTVSHDHFDHLDMATVKHLAASGAHFFVGLGVGAHLEVWDVPAQQIHEMDWGDSAEHAGVKIHCTPAQHYSGRTSINKSTLWTSWVLDGPEHRVFHSGDSGYASHFEKIGEKHGPFDIAFLKVGDYGEGAAWQYIHMVPEDSVKAFTDLGAEVMFPIHWGTVQLSYHPWDEPIERTVAAADEANATLVTPKLGQTYDHAEAFASSTWWRSL